MPLTVGSRWRAIATLVLGTAAAVLGVAARPEKAVSGSATRVAAPEARPRAAPVEPTGGDALPRVFDLPLEPLGDGVQVAVSRRAGEVWFDVNPGEHGVTIRSDRGEDQEELRALGLKVRHLVDREPDAYLWFPASLSYRFAMKFHTAIDNVGVTPLLVVLGDRGLGVLDETIPGARADPRVGSVQIRILLAGEVAIIERRGRSEPWSSRSRRRNACVPEPGPPRLAPVDAARLAHWRSGPLGPVEVAAIELAEGSPSTIHVEAGPGVRYGTVVELFRRLGLSGAGWSVILRPPP